MRADVPSAVALGDWTVEGANCRDKGTKRKKKNRGKAVSREGKAMKA